jgi:hypothetical protein
MKKHYYLALTMLLAAFAGYAQQKAVYWSEDFEGNWSTNWTISSGSWEVGVPFSGPNAAHGGTKCAATVLGGDYVEDVDSRLISPVVTVPAANQNPRLRFWQWYSFSTYDFGRVQIKSTSSTDWVDIGEQYINTGSGIWTYPSIDLSAYAGQSIQIAYYFHSNGDFWGTSVSAGWYIDDIAIVTGPVVFNNPETWENGLGDWYADRGTWEVGSPTSGPNATHGGTKCAATVLGGDYVEDVDSRLISPVVTVPAANQNPRLRFWQWYSFSSYDFGIVQIRTAGSSSWIDLSSQLQNTNCSNWIYQSIDLSSYYGQTVQLAFYFHSEGDYWGTSVSSGWYIDDISISDATAASKTLNINTVFLEGLYLGGGVMRKAQDINGDKFPGNTADQITIELHNSCYTSTAYTIPNVNLSTSGIATTTVYGDLQGSYYITIKHRNSITTTSANPVSFNGSTVTYSFSSAASQAYGNNMKLVGGKYVVYGGDLTQDGSIDTGDMVSVDNDSYNYMTGYLNSDTNGDGVIDTGDMVIVDNNAGNYISTITP